MKKAAVIGYGKSGKGAEAILSMKGYSVDLFDDSKTGCRKLSEFVDDYDVVSVTPGIDLKTLPFIQNLKSEIELAYSMMPDNCMVFAVTGTNGKSSVTYLAEQVLNNAGIDAIACGNIGKPFSEAVLEAEDNTVFIVELSSFQLEQLEDFEVDTAIITNLTPDHLDRYESVEEYFNAKLRVIDLIKPFGQLISSPDMMIVNKMLRMQTKVKYMDSDLNAWPKKEDNMLVIDGFCVDLREFSLIGKHNIINVTFALELCSIAAQRYGIEMKGNMSHLIKNLKGMPHRLETAAYTNGIRWIDDSKATNVESTMIALNCFESSVILMLGGKDKNSDYSKLVPEINRCVKMLCFFGGAADKINKAIGGKVNCPSAMFNTLRDATEYAATQAVSGDIVLLAPGCSSFDEFESFEHRGRQFSSYVNNILSRG